MENDFDKIADIVVVGFGAAGTAAAITARKAGASVILLEKQARERHTPSTMMSGGMVMAVNHTTAAVDYLDRCAAGMVPREVTTAWALRAVGLIDWLEDIAPDLGLCRVGGAEHPGLPGYAAIDVYQPGGAIERLDVRGKTGKFLFERIAPAVLQSGAEVLWNSPADRLMVSEDGERIVGVRTAAGLTVGARKGVILTCGGYLHNERMKRDYLRAYPMYFYGNPGNVGDGVRMAQEVGADLWHMNQMIGRAIGHFPWEGSENGLSMMLFINPPGYVITDRYGRRYADESKQGDLLHGFYYHMLQYDPEKGNYPRNPSYWFFDESRRKAGRLTLPSVGAHAVGIYDWSEDNSREIARGWIVQGATIAEAAAAAGVKEPAAAQATVAEYNRACAGEMPDPFGRPSQTMVPIETPPFYCVKLYPGGSNTTGGPRRDSRAQVLDTRGEPIRGLYAAGELGQATGMQYPSDGSNLSEAFCFGQIAAESALGCND